MPEPIAMTPQEFRSAREQLGLSAGRLAHILNVDKRTLRRWESVDGSAARPPNPIACRVLTWLLAGYRPPEWYEAVGGVAGADEDV